MLFNKTTMQVMRKTGNTNNKASFSNNGLMCSRLMVTVGALTCVCTVFCHIYVGYCLGINMESICIRGYNLTVPQNK